MEPTKGEVDKIVDSLVRMRIEQFASRKTMVDFLTKKLGYKTTFAYELINQSKAKIAEMFKDEHDDAFNDAVARLDALIEKEKSTKLRLDLEKEKNKLLGLHRPTRIDVTTNGKDVNIVQVEIIYPKDEAKD